MKASELIKDLQEHIEAFGDLECKTWEGFDVGVEYIEVKEERPDLQNGGIKKLESYFEL